MFELIDDDYKNLSIGLGFFDGVHRAHKSVILNTVNLAKKYNCKSAIITFNNHPAECAGKNVEYISTIKDRDELIKEFGVDYIFSLDFNESIMNTTREEYLKLLCEKFNPKAITTGFNHTFGKSRLGTSQYLKESAIKYGYEYYCIEPEKLNGEIISSTAIREKLKKGDIRSANEFLGHCFSIEGEVIYGRQLGRKLGFPTANIIYPDKLVKIPYGVYKVKVELDKKTYSGMMNFGIKPTIDDSNNIPVVEVHILNFHNDIYGRIIKINIEAQIRPEKKFNSLDELKAQIEKDIALC